ncbi:hypothetical protein Nepgr_015607 [Nepenthes gracilis]|uniref:Peroxiredoxin Q, chloroplastic n=1 Tax=Nepenthes gracilis TaxID=150966 RepID=A0AAD3SNX1_NEPGR|nr:hypothetical protein Nepgr_015607 [Nepenthes gracilis]
MGASSFGSGSRRSNYSRSFDLPEDEGSCGVGGGMLPVFLNDLRRKDSQELVEVELQLEDDNIVVCSVTPNLAGGGEDHGAATGARVSTSLSSASNKLRQKFAWLRSASSRASSSSSAADFEQPAISARDALRIKGQLQRTRSSAQRALGGLRFISKTTDALDKTELWKQVESRFESLAKNGFLTREDFGECIGMVDSKEFAVGIFDALARRKRQRISKIKKEELYDFWLQLSDQSFDARLQIFFDMADSNEDGKITREEVQELIMLSASANKLCMLKEKAHEYADLIMEELDPDNLGYIELWQLETLLLQKDIYMEYSRPLSTASLQWSQNLSSLRPKSMVQRISSRLKNLILENWQRSWPVLLWLMAMASLFIWKLNQYRNTAAFHVMGYCVCIAKGAAETLKLNMALILLPVCRNTLTWLRSTKARLFIPFDDNINFHKIIACAIVIGTVLHAGDHLTCDFPRLVMSSPEKFAYLSSNFDNKKPSYGDLLTSIVGVTGITMVILMAISFTLATSRFRRNVVRLPAPFNRLAGYNAFWYSHHLLGLVYLLLLIHGYFLLLAKQWYKRTVSELPGNVFSITMTKPQGFRYKSGQYIFLRCPPISKFEWHPFSITSAPGDNYLSLHIRMVGDWTKELKRVFTEGNNPESVIGRFKFSKIENMDLRCSPTLLVDGPYGAPAQDYQNYDVLLLVGLGIGATPFISILKDLLNNKRSEERMDSNTEFNTSDDSLNSFASSITSRAGKRKPMRVKSAHFYWVTREPGSFEWFKGVMDEVAEMDQKGLIDMHNYLTSVYEEGDARSTLITMIQALNHAKYGIDILSGTQLSYHPPHSTPSSYRPFKVSIVAKVTKGSVPPPFSLKDQAGKNVSLSKFKGKPVVVYFYPADETPGCTKQACAFRDSYEKFKKAGAEVVGISGDDTASHKAFAAKYRLPFTLLSDEGNKVRKEWGVPADFFGSLPGRQTYVLDKNGVVQLIYNNQFQPEKHIDETLKLLQSL